MIWMSSYLWLQRLRGGSAVLNLACDPVPHGLPVLANLKISKTIPFDKWRVEVAIVKIRGEDVPDTVWKQTLPVHRLDDQHGKTEIMLPSNIFSTADSHQYKATLMLVADKIVWMFDLKTFHPKNLITPA